MQFIIYTRRNDLNAWKYEHVANSLAWAMHCLSVNVGYEIETLIVPRYRLPDLLPMVIGRTQTQPDLTQYMENRP